MNLAESRRTLALSVNPCTQIFMFSKRTVLLRWTQLARHKRSGSSPPQLPASWTDSPAARYAFHGTHDPRKTVWTCHPMHDSIARATRRSTTHVVV